MGYVRAKGWIGKDRESLHEELLEGQRPRVPTTQVSPVPTAPRLQRSEMSTFRVSVEIGDPQGQRWRAVEALVDTGASYTWVPASILRGLDLTPGFRLSFILADGREIERDAAETRVRLDGQVRTRIVVFGDEGTSPLLGAGTLEGFGLAPDPINKRLIRVPGLLMSTQSQR